MKGVVSLLIWMIRLYRWTLSPLKNAFLGGSGCCRFTPTCSCYAAEALQRHGLACGSVLALRRLLRCHPWGSCGHDPVPAATQTPPSAHQQPSF